MQQFSEKAVQCKENRDIDTPFVSCSGFNCSNSLKKQFNAKRNAEGGGRSRETSRIWQMQQLIQRSKCMLQERVQISWAPPRLKRRSACWFCLFSDSSKSTTRITKDFKNRFCKKREEEEEEADMPVAGSSADEPKLHQSEALSPPEQQSCPLERKRSPHCHHLWPTPDSHLQLHQDQNASSKDSAEGDGASADEIRRQWSTPAEVERARKFASLPQALRGKQELRLRRRSSSRSTRVIVLNGHMQWPRALSRMIIIHPQKNELPQPLLPNKYSRAHSFANLL